jgi:integrase
MNMGMLYQRGRTWWVKYYRAGKMYRESSGSSKKGVARELLQRREGSIASGTFTGLKPEKTTFDELSVDFINDYKVNGRAAVETAEKYAERLGKHFSGMRAVHITGDKVMAYIGARKQEETRIGTIPSNGTLNRELAALRRMFNLGRNAGKVIQVPYVPTLEENNVRKGFFSHEDFLKLRDSLSTSLKPIATLSYYTGMRRGEVLGLKWAQVDFNERTITLNPGETKNGEARLLPMAGEVFHTLQAQKALRDEKFPSCEYVFFSHRTGKRVRCFRTGWKNACKRVKLTGAKFHDFRRTAVRNLVRAGTPEKVCMLVSGHKTRAVFERYNIATVDDVKAAVSALETYLAKPTGTIQAQSASSATPLDQSITCK